MITLSRKNNISPGYRPPQAAGGLVSALHMPLLLVLLAALALLAGPRAVPAVEFVTPPGMNIPGQEQLLKEKVQRLAHDLVGDKLLNVEVHIGYLRAGTGPDSQGRIKLPGFNNYITPQTDSGAVLPGYSRIRQVFILVDETFRGNTKAVEQQLRVSGGFDPAGGDWVKVIGVPPPEAEPQAAEKPQMQEPPLQKPPEPPEKEEETAGKNGEGKEDPAASEETMPAKVDMVTQAKSTENLIKARRYFFKGRYEQALEQILQSIQRNPNNPQAYTMLGSLYYKMNWKSMALKYWERALELDPDNKELNELVDRMQE
ncbi:MAG: tetratricopeptide repeat protein [Deltaproteobacteria bacterium]|nr:tetratricopeptide repeat protein [Deltaproteobacteria bacterium]